MKYDRGSTSHHDKGQCNVLDLGMWIPFDHRGKGAKSQAHDDTRNSKEEPGLVEITETINQDHETDERCEKNRKAIILRLLIQAILWC